MNDENDENFDLVTDVAEIKKQIEDRYHRLKKGKRRPSLEYVSMTDVRDVFLPYVENKEGFKTLTNDQVRLLYQLWYEKNKDVIIGVEKEGNEKEGEREEDLDIPDIQG